MPSFSCIFDWGASLVGLVSSNPYISIPIALVQAGIQFSCGNIIGGVICLLGAIPIPMANKFTKILGQYAGLLIKTGIAPKRVIQIIAKIIGNLSQSLKAWKGMSILVTLFIKYKQGKLSWNELTIVVNYMLGKPSKGGLPPGLSADIEVIVEGDDVRAAIKDLYDFFSKMKG